MHYVVSCNLAIWLRCEENSANMVSTVFRGGCDVHRGMKNCDFRPLSCVISEMIPDMAIDTMEDELQEFVCGLSNGASRSRHSSTSNN